MTERIQLTANQSGPVRRETFMGREHVVVPATLVRSQVLNNNLGRCFLPANEITDDWAQTANHSPVIIDHPSKRGRPVSAKDPDVINEMGVGQLYNVRVEDGELKGDVFLDPARAEDVGDLAAILERVEDGEPVELSTGFPLREAKPAEGVHNGERYDLVIRPAGFDHLAVFAEKTGACSVSDGCGLGIHEDEDDDCGCGEVQNVRDSPREPTFDGTESTEWSAPDLEDFVDGIGLEDVETVEDLTDAQKSTIAEHSLLGESDADTFADLVFFPVVDPSSGNLNENALRAVISGRGSQADIPADALERAQDTARDLLESEFDMDGEDEDAENALPAPPDSIDPQDEATNSWWKSVLMTLVGARNQDEETSLDDVRHMLSEAVEERFGGPNVFTHVVEMFEDDFVYSVDPQGNEGQMFRAPYTVTDGEVDIGERVEVEKVTEFVPAEDTENEKRLTVRHEYLALEPNAPEEGDMNREEMLDALNECDDVAFRRETLEAMNDDELAHVANEAGVTGEEPEADEPEPEPAENDNEVPEWADALQESVESLGERMDRLEEETEPARNETAEQRQEMIEKIVANTDFEDEELEGKPLTELQKIHDATDTKARNYAGLGGPRRPDPSDESELSFNVRSTWGAGPGEPVKSEEK